jgi:tRNA U34 5-carboxymethylaminomethyl modifying GTPase MnmE/TrmE
MKIKQGFVVREVAGKSVAVATGALSREFHGMVTLNGTGKFLFEELKNVSAPKIAVLNKSDKQRCFPEELLADSAAVVQLCARERDTAALREAIERLYLAEGITLGKDPVVSNARQHAALSRAVEALSRTVASLAADVPLDAACIDAELAMQALGEVDGRAVDESILADIFSHFCVGK